jgi:hypothetical protein
LKGLARLVAAPSLAAVCDHIEAHMRVGNLDDALATRFELDREWERVRQYLDSQP